MTTVDVEQFLESTGVDRKVVEYRRSARIFAQGDPCDRVFYVQKGSVKLLVISDTGREAVLAMLGPGEFFGVECLAGQAMRMGTATANVASTILIVAKEEMIQLL